MKLIDNRLMFGGQQQRYQHHSDSTQCEMTFSVFLPPVAQQKKVPALYWLSGLTCNDQNFATKAGAQALAAELGLAIVMPDTSPRGEGVADAPEGEWDLGLGAGFYVNATQAPWSTHYQMLNYVVHELPALLEASLPFTNKRSVAGHSMGGHGALSLALLFPQHYQSASAFAPIANPTKAPWGQKAFAAYLGSNREAWEKHDTVCLINTAQSQLPLLVDTGAADEYLQAQLGFAELEQACKATNFPATLRLQPGYDHSYYFIATFVNDHLRFHAKHLGL